MVVIEGQAGIGKTRLLAEAAARGRANGMTVLTARASELEREFGYGVVRQLFERTLSELPAEERADVLCCAAQPAATVLVAEVPDAAGGDASFSTLHGLYWVAANLAERRSLLIAIDDLHWCDVQSLRWLAYLQRRLEGLRIVIAVALRPAEPSAPESLLAHVVHDPLARVLRPGALSRAAARRLVRSVLSEEADEAFCAACHDESGGNPLLLEQLLGAVATERMAPTAAAVERLRTLGANAVARVVALRFARLDPAAPRLAAAVAILGDGVALGTAAALAGLEPDAALDAATALGGADILHRGEPLAFVHPVVRAAVRERIRPPERSRLHARAARLLAEGGGAPESIAAQLLHASPAGDAWAVERLRVAAAQALGRGAADSAVAYLRRALEEPPPADERFALLAELAMAELLVDGPAAVEHLQQARALAPTPVLRAEMAGPLAASLYLVSRPQDSLDVLRQGLAELGPEHAELRRHLEVEQLHVSLTQARYIDSALALLRRYEDEPLGDPDLTSCSLAAWRAFHGAYRGASRAEVLEHARAALAGGLLVARANGGGAWAGVAMALLAADDREAAELIEASLAAAHRHGSGLGFAAVKVFGSRLHLLRGELAEAEAAASDGLEACEAWGIAFGPMYAGAYLADALMERGRVAAAAEALGSIAPAETPGFASQTSWYLEACARLRLRQGRLREGVARMLDFGREFAALGGRNPAFHPWRSEAALGLLGLGEGAQARELVAEEVELAATWGVPLAHGRALRAAGLVEQGGRGLALLGDAVDLLAPSTARLEHAKALVELGAALRRANRRRDARGPLREALALATICDAAGVAERAETELLASGGRLRPQGLPGVASLTASERRVADLAAAGASNRDIAQQLYVTVKTVEVHLSSVYRKLDLKSRTQLGRALAPAAPEPAGGA